MINKRFFLMNASITTLVQLKALVSVKRNCTVISSNKFQSLYSRIKACLFEACEAIKLKKLNDNITGCQM